MFSLRKILILFLLIFAFNFNYFGQAVAEGKEHEIDPECSFCVEIEICQEITKAKNSFDKNSFHISDAACFSRKDNSHQILSVKRNLFLKNITLSQEELARSHI